MLRRWKCGTDAGLRARRFRLDASVGTVLAGWSVELQRGIGVLGKRVPYCPVLWPDETGEGRNPRPGSPQTLALLTEAMGRRHKATSCESLS